jgi:hypothetical protein
VSNDQLIEYAMQTLRHMCYGHFLAHHVMECHGCNAKATCQIESVQRIFAP